ncbi:MAG TPA: Gfo/Idh/MocA family oxidoreductase, partial [bacterium]|nr:Gfo/Idh/MocA family oxidoreductase [bacterium]
MGFCAYPEVQVVAVCDVDAPRCEGAKRQVDAVYGNQDCACIHDFREIIQRRDIDIVCIATPDHWHAIPAIWAMRSGKDVFVEKPLSLTIAEGRALVNTAKECGSVTQVNTWQRSIHNFQHACDLIQGGRLGRVHTAKVGLPGGPSQPPQPEVPVPEGFDYDFWLGQAPWAPYHPSRCHGAFRACFDYSGGGLTDWGAHHLDVVQWYMNRDSTGPVKIEGTGEFPTEGIWNTATSYHFICTYDDGFTLEASTSFRGGVRFEGEDGRWLHVDRGVLETNPADLRKQRIAPDEMKQLWVSGDHNADFLNSIRTRRPTVTPVEIGHRSISIAHLANICMRLGRSLRWDPAQEHFIDDPSADRMLSRAMRQPWHL